MAPMFLCGDYRNTFPASLMHAIEEHSIADVPACLWGRDLITLCESLDKYESFTCFLISRSVSNCFSLFQVERR